MLENIRGEEGAVKGFRRLSPQALQGRGFHFAPRFASGTRAEERMSGAGSGGNRGNGPSSATTAAIAIPSGSRKLVHSLKEIVNCSEAEIYAMLCECNMDPDEAVNRLLSQGARPLNFLLCQ